MRRSTISNESATSDFSVFQGCKPFDKEELHTIENRSTASRKGTRFKHEDLYGSIAPTDDDIDEELNLMGTYL